MGERGRRQGEREREGARRRRSGVSAMRARTKGVHLYESDRANDFMPSVLPANGRE